MTGPSFPLPENRKSNFLLHFVFISLFLFLWFWRWQAVNYQRTTNLAKITGFIWEKPTINYSYQQFQLGDYLVETSTSQNLNIGDKITLVGKPECQMTGKYREQCSINYPEITKENNNLLSALIRLVARLREKLIASLEKMLPSEAASLLTGIVWGNQGQFSRRFYNDMKISGLLHVVVASGANISSLISLISKGGRFFSRRQLAIFILLTIGIYSLIVGNDPPILRALIMSILMLSSQLIGRPKRPLRNLLLAGAIMLIFKPRILFDISFQLSFGASLGILLLGRRLRKLLHWESLATTVAAQIITTPILAIQFGQLSPLSFISNAFLLWLIEPLMIWGLGLTGLALISYPLAILVGTFLWFPLQLFIWGGHFLAQLLPIITINSQMALASLLVIPLSWLLLKKFALAENEK